MADNTPQSREEALLQNILGAQNELGIPQSRIEKIWQYALGIDGIVLDPPQSRIEVLAIQVAELVRNGGGGGGTEYFADIILDRSISGEYANSRVETLGLYIFTGTKNLTAVSFPNVKTIGSNALGSGTVAAALTSLKAAWFANVESIGTTAFRNAGVEALIMSDITAVPSLGTNALQNTPIENGTGYIYVPDTLVDTMKADASWSTFASQIKPMSELPPEYVEPQDTVPKGELDITENGTYNVIQYASANVAIPEDHTAEDGIVERDISGNYVNPRITKVGQYCLHSKTQLTRIEFANVTNTGTFSIYGCTSLEEVIFPRVAVIGGNGLKNCSALRLLNLYSPDRESVPSMASTSLENTAIADGNGWIVINDDLVDTLKASSNWSVYSSQIIGHTAAIQQGIITA